MINKITSSKPYFYQRFGNNTRVQAKNTFRKYVGLPLAALVMTSVYSCMAENDNDRKITFFTCPQDKTNFSDNCASTPERIDYMLKTLKIIPDEIGIKDISKISYTDGNNNISVENIKQNDDGDIFCNKIKTDKNGNKDTFAIQCNNLPGYSRYIPVKEFNIKNGEIQSGKSTFIYESGLDENTFLAKNLDEEWLYAVYPKSNAIIKETPLGERQTIKVTGYTRK